MPAVVFEVVRLAREAEWAAQCRYSSPEWRARLWQPGRGGGPGRVRFELAWRLGSLPGQSARGWREVRAAEVVEWSSTLVTSRRVTVREVRAMLRGTP